MNYIRFSKCSNDEEFLIENMQNNQHDILRTTKNHCSKWMWKCVHMLSVKLSSWCSVVIILYTCQGGHVYSPVRICNTMRMASISKKNLNTQETIINGCESVFTWSQWSIILMICGKRQDNTQNVGHKKNKIPTQYCHLFFVSMSLVSMWSVSVLEQFCSNAFLHRKQCFVL